MKFPDNEKPVWYSFICENAKRYATHIPHDYTYLETSIVPSSDDVLNCRKREGIKYRVITNVYTDPPLLVQSTEIYHKNIGMIPNYGGHIPGAMFRCGKTFGVDSKFAKIWLRKDFDL